MSKKRLGNIELGAVLGVGGFGKVYLGHDLDMQQDVAIKLVDKARVRTQNLGEYVKREIEIMKMIRHPNVIQLYQFIDLPNSFCLVMELANQGELFDRIIESKRFDEKTARRYFQQLISAVRYCHRKGIVHRDLKAENLLLGKDETLKVCDFGLSRYAVGVNPCHGEAHQMHVLTSIAGSIDYQAPEMWSADGYQGFACDVWSCGVILFFMLCGYLPFSARSDEETEARAAHAQYNKNDKHLSPAAADLISKILVCDPAKRFTTADIIKHEWFREKLDPNLFPDENLQSPLQETPKFATHLGGVSPEEHDNAKNKEATELMIQLNKAFEAVNTNKSRGITREEMRDALVELSDGAPISNKELQVVMSCFQTTRVSSGSNGSSSHSSPKNGTSREKADDENEDEDEISQEAFIAGWATLEKRTHGKYPLHRLVNICKSELHGALVADLRKAFKRLDIGDNGVVTSSELMKIPELNLTKAEAVELVGVMNRHKTSATGITFDDFVAACTKDDIVRRHAVGTKLLRLQELFHAVDSTFSVSYVNNGFTVKGLVEAIEKKLIEKGPGSSCQTTFTRGETGNYIHGAHTLSNLQIGIQLLPACLGYTKVLAYRMRGKTQEFHDWFRAFREGLLREEIVRCQEDTSIEGESISI